MDTQTNKETTQTTEVLHQIYTVYIQQSMLSQAVVSPYFSS